MRRTFLIYLMISFISLFAISLSAQNTTIKGLVFDKETREPMIGVSVVLSGTTNGSITDFNGEFQINIPKIQNESLQLTYVGYQPLTFPLKSDAYIRIAMTEDSKLIDEVVVVGYATQKKESVIGSIASINNSTLKALPVSNVSQALAGKLAGVQVVQPSGEVGRDEADVYVRGLATYGNAKPLIIVDGIIRESFSQIDPNEIQSLNVLKDASATAVFGVKGANGVIIVTTRRGEASKPQISFSSQFAITQPQRIPDPLHAYQTAAMLNTIRHAQGSNDDYSALDLLKYQTGSSPYLHPNTRWVDEVMKDNSTMQQYNLNVSGGNKFVKYFVSGGYLSQDGFYKNDPYTNFNRFNFRSNLDFNITQRLTASFNLGSRVEKRQYPAEAMWGSWGIYRGAFTTGGRHNPVYNPDGSLAGPATNAYNLLGAIGDRGVFRENKSVVEMGLTVRHDLDFILDGLSVRGQMAFDNAGSNGELWERTYATYYYNVIRDSKTDSDKEVYIQQGENSPLTYRHGINSFDQKFYYEIALDYAKSFGSNSFTGLFLANRSTRLIGDQISFADQGLVGRVTYDFDKRYFTEVNVGYNGSENFDQGNRYALFPAFAMGWMISNERFISETAAANVISNMKLRGSIGWVGNDKSDSRFIYIQQFINGGGAHFGSGDNWFNGIYQGNIANKDVTWETGRKINVGLETNLFNSLLGINIDAFYERRSDILTNISSIVPDYVGKDFMNANVGIVDNKGVEIEAFHNYKIGQNFTYGIRGNFSFTRNKVVKKADPLGLLPYQREEGYPIGTALMYKYIGVFEDFEDIANSPSQMGLNGNTEVRPGDCKYLDFNGDGIIDEKDAFRQGYGTVPEIQYGISANMSYKNFDLNILFQGSAHVNFAKNWEIMWPFSNHDNAFSQHWNYWTPETNGDHEHIRFYGNYLNNEPSGGRNSLTMGNGDYIRLKNLEFGYTLPKAWTSKAFMTGARVYFAANNLALWAKEPFLDPDNRDIRGGLMPQTRAFNFGLNVNF